LPPVRYDGVLEVEDLTDNEREEQLRRWWSENWLWIVGGIALGLALLWGWQYWQGSKARVAQRDAAAYTAVLDALGQNKFDDAVQKAKALRAESPASPYADQSDLALARAAIENRKLDDAAQRLKAVADGSKDQELRTIALTRLARVQIEQGKFDDAVALLDTAKAGSFLALFHDVRGDAFAAKGDAAAARREYDSALAAARDDVQIDRAYVELKRDALPAVATPAPAAGAAGK
jgi:predicted negative regulator of RcsB-dependent stress response